MTYYDAAMAAVVIAGMVWGAWRGITWQLASIASLVLGYSVAHPLSGQLAPQFPGEPVVARALAMLVIYVAVSGGIFLAAWVVRATLRRLQFEAFDRHLGMVLGGLEGALLGLVATFFLTSLAPQLRTPVFSSPTGRLVAQVMDAVGPVLPTEVREELAPFWNGAEPGSPSLAGEAPKSAGDTGASTGSLPSLIEKEESRLGRAVIETAEKEIHSLGAGGTDGGAVERR
jgi:membrane protein required for colicin V production